MKKIQLTIYTAFISAAILISCKKETKITSLTPPAPIDTSSCVTGRGVNSGTIIPGQYIVAYNSGTVNKGSSASTMLRASQNVLARNDIAETQLKQVFGGEPAGFVVQLSDDEVARLNEDPAIKLVEHDRVISLGGCFTIAEPRLLTWNIRRVGYGDGRGKTAWIIDTGIDIDHPDLNVDAARSRSFLPGVTSADDENGHGTHVAGIIGGLNNSIGITGVASGASLVALRVLDADGKIDTMAGSIDHLLVER